MVGGEVVFGGGDFGEFLIRHVVGAEFIKVESVVFVGEKGGDSDNIFGGDVYGEGFGCHLVMRDGDFVATRGERVLTVLIGVIAVYGDVAIEGGDVKVDGGDFGGLPDENRYEDDYEDDVKN